MKRIVYIFALLVTLGLTSTFAQSLNTDESPYTTKSATQERMSILSGIYTPQANTDNFLNSSAAIQNQVLIQQIGAGNISNVNVRSETSDISVIQKGNFNNLDMSINAPEINSTIVQNGDNNSVIDNIYYTNLPVEMQVIQNGDNLSVNRIGTNSLTNRIQLVQQGSNKTITVISN